MATSHISDKIAAVPTKCRRQMMYLMFHNGSFKYGVNSSSNMYLDINAYHMFTKNIQCKQRTDMSLKKNYRFSG